MGKSVPKGIKSRAALLIERFPEKFGKSFDQNKQFVRELNFPISKKERNVMAGFLVRKSKKVQVV